MDASDLTLGAVVVLSLGASLAGPLLLRRVFQVGPTRPRGYFREEGALAQAEGEVRQPFELALPAGPALEVMLRYTADLDGASLRGRSAHNGHGLAVLVEVRREPAEGGGAPVEQRYERVIGQSSTLGKAPVAPGEPSYDTVRLGLDYTATKVLARVPAGGPGTVRILVDNTFTPVRRLCLFAKAAG